MCIYCGTAKYRKIYESHFGPIPKDEYGRSYEIHHIDGNRNNNDLTNLKCVSVQEHYDIHYSQEDWMACYKIALKLRLSGDEISELARKQTLQQVSDGTHTWLKKSDGTSVGKAITDKRIKEGTHHFLNSEWHSLVNKKLVKEGRHNFLGSSHNKKLLETGKHPSQNTEIRKRLSEIQKVYNKERVEKGEHSFQKLNSYVWTCNTCGKTGKHKANLTRHRNSKNCN